MNSGAENSFAGTRDTGTPKISVIVPVYNVEKYLRECVDSVLAQTFTDFELILVDDGSPDDSGKICDEYAAKDSRVRVFHKANGGVVEARFFGLKQARGDYVVFLDSDDSWTKTALDGLWAETRNGTIDYVRAGFMYENAKREICSTVVPATRGKFAVSELLQRPFETVFHFTGMCVCGGGARRKVALAAASDIESAKINWGEDGLFAVAIFLRSKTAAFSRDPFYYYLQREGSALHQFNPRVVESCEVFCNAMENILARSGQFSRERVKEIVRTHSAQLASYAFSMSLRAPFSQEREKLANALRESNFFRRAREIPRKTNKQRVMFFLMKNQFLFKVFATALALLRKTRDFRRRENGGG